MVKRVGVIGFGHLGQFLVSKIISSEQYELAFVWNRSRTKIHLEPEFILEDLNEFSCKQPDIVVEVAHPSITKSHGKMILQYCDYMIGSPTALCDEDLLKELTDSAVEHGLYIPSGAFWGGEDIKKMSEAGKIKSMKVTMKKHPLSLKLEGYLKEKNLSVKDEPVTLYESCVRHVCDLAPNNTNTMAAAAMAAPCLGFDNVIGCLVADPSLTDCHIVEIEVQGYPKEDGSFFHVHTVRKNPAVVGEVTGEATYHAYFGSLKRALGKGPGVHLC